VCVVSKVCKQAARVFWRWLCAVLCVCGLTSEVWCSLLTHHADGLVDEPRRCVGVLRVDAGALKHLGQELDRLGVEALWG
jgi:hypothetical protein